MFACEPRIPCYGMHGVSVLLFVQVGMGISEYRIQNNPNPKQSGIQIEI